MHDPHRVEFEVTEELANQVAKATLGDRRFWSHFATYFGAPLLILYLLIAVPFVATFSSRLSAAGVLGILLVLAMAFVAELRLIIYSNTRNGLLLFAYCQPERSIQLTFTEDHIGMGVAGMTGEKKWRDLNSIRILPTLWIFQLKPMGSFILPVSAMSPELEEMIRRKAGEVGVEIY